MLRNDTGSVSDSGMLQQSQTVGGEVVATRLINRPCPGEGSDPSMGIIRRGL
jgi:hypothetical protein